MQFRSELHVWYFAPAKVQVPATHTIHCSSDPDTVSDGIRGLQTVLEASGAGSAIGDILNREAVTQVEHQRK